MNSEVVIASVFGRGNWLASYLAQAGLKVRLYDLSEILGRWTPEDWEGPFGFFKSQNLLDSQLERISYGEELEAVSNGFAVWTRQNVYELQGPLYHNYIDRGDLSADVEEYLKTEPFEERRKLLQEKLQNLSYSKRWLVRVAEELSRTTVKEDINELSDSFLPLFSNYFIRRSTRKGFDLDLEWCRNKGCEVFSEAKIIDVSVKLRTVEGVEVILPGGRSEFVSAQNLIWMLSSEETLACGEGLYRKMFPKGHIEPIWFWARYRLRIPNTERVEVLPKKLILIKDIYQSLETDNLFIFEKTDQKELYDVWVKLPNHQRFQTAYLDKIRDAIQEELKLRLGDVTLDVVEMPRSYNLEYRDLWAPRFGVYDERALAKLQSIKLNNLFFDGPEKWVTLDWSGQFRSHKQLADKIVEWKRLRNLTLAKESAEKAND